MTCNMTLYCITLWVPAGVYSTFDKNFDFKIRRDNKKSAAPMSR